MMFPHASPSRQMSRYSPTIRRAPAVLADLRVGTDIERPAYVINLEEPRQCLDAAPAQTRRIDVAIGVTVHSDRDIQLAAHTRKACTLDDTFASSATVTGVSERCSEHCFQRCEHRARLSGIHNVTRDQLGVRTIEDVSHANLETHGAPLCGSADMSETV